MAKASNRRTVVKAALRIVKVADLKVDRSYQREVKNKIGKIAAEFNEEAFGVPLVGERDDGTLWIVDGQQRIEALKIMGKKEVRAEVFASQGPEHEAAVFKLVNMYRTKLTPHEEFKALLTAGDADVWEIQKAVEAAGFRFVAGKGGKSPETRGRDVTCHNTFRRAYADYGIEPIQFLLALVKDVWPDDPLAVNTAMVGGLALFWYRRDEGAGIDRPKLVERLRRVTPHKVLYEARQRGVMVSSGGGIAYAVADTIERLYSKRLPKPKDGSVGS